MADSLLTTEVIAEDLLFDFDGDYYPTLDPTVKEIAESSEAKHELCGKYELQCGHFTAAARHYINGMVAYTDCMWDYGMMTEVPQGTSFAGILLKLTGLSIAIECYTDATSHSPAYTLTFNPFMVQHAK
jgi:hypothetical protein